MRDEYLAAPRNSMMIRIVEPSAFKRRIVTERRPLCFFLEPDITADEVTPDFRSAVLSVIALVVSLAAFACVLTYALESFVSTL